MIVLNSDGPAATADEVLAFEAMLLSPLPVDYRQFLLKRNGGHLAPNWWPPERGVADFGLTDLYGLGDVPHYRSLADAREVSESRIPDDLVAVGVGPGGVQVCAALGEDGTGIWLYDPELETDPDPDADDDPGPLPDLLTRVCDSFTQLIDGLEPRPGLDEMRRRVAAAGGRRR